jgi:hypothetical protein
MFHLAFPSTAAGRLARRPLPRESNLCAAARREEISEISGRPDGPLPKSAPQD